MLRFLLAGVLSLLITNEATAAATPRLELAGERVFLPTPRRGVYLKAYADYVKPDGVELFCRYMFQTRSDTFDVAYHMRSLDNGRTWSDPIEVPTHKKVPGGVLRMGQRPGFVDPDRGVLLVLGGTSLLPSDHPLERMTRGRMSYKLSRDGGATYYHEGPVIQKGEEFDADHPLPGVWYGKNATQIGDLSTVPIKLRSGEILVPLQITPVGPDGKYYNPGGGYTYHDVAVLIGTWNDADTIDWRLSQRIVGDPQRSTRGVLEPTLAEMPDGRVLVVMRGSNDSKGKLAGYRWYSVSSDGGRTWKEPAPWKYTDGQPFFSPSSCSRLIWHSSGDLLWIGNITPTNPRANAPRYPLVIGTVDPESLLLVKESVLEIDTRRPGDHPQMTFSNFYVREDRETKEIVIYCSPIGRAHRLEPGQHKARPWTADSVEYRVAIKE